MIYPFHVQIYKDIQDWFPMSDPIAHVPAKPYTFDEVRDYDRVRITGKTFDYRSKTPVQIRVENLIGTIGSGVVGATFPAGEQRAIKIWPEDPNQPYNDSGKIWFDENDIEKLELLEREEPDT